MAVDILTQDSIERNILPYLSKGKRGCSPKEEWWRIVKAIIERLETGCQWRKLPMKELFQGQYSWRSVYHHWRRWCRDGSWQYLWKELLQSNKHVLDISNANIDGSHTRAVKGGDAVGYQGRKKAKTSNMLSISDSTGLPIALGEVHSGEHNDTYRIGSVMRAMVKDLKQAGIEVEGLFFNADASFDTKAMRQVCSECGIELNAPINTRNSKASERDEYFDEVLYKKRGAIERSYAWLDSFRALILRYEVRKKHWRCLNILACVILLLKRILKTL